MSEIDRDLSETSDDEDLRFFENLQESFDEEKARGGIFVDPNSGFAVDQNTGFVVEQNRGFVVDQNRGVCVDLRSELIESDPNVFHGQKEHSREDFRLMLSVYFLVEVLKFKKQFFPTL